MFWPGISGKFMRYLPVTVFTVLSGSLIYALVFGPTLGALFGKAGTRDAKAAAALKELEEGDPTKLKGPTGVYARLLTVATRFAPITFVLTVGVVVGAFILYNNAGTGMVFFNEGDLWQIARDPSSINAVLDIETLRSTGTATSRPMLPYYLLMTLPDEDQASFLILQPFTPRSTPNMVGFLVAKSDPESFGEMIQYQFPLGNPPDGPNQVGGRINQDTAISSDFTLLGQQGSEIVQGNMLVDYRGGGNGYPGHGGHLGAPDAGGIYDHLTANIPLGGSDTGDFSCG